MSSFGGKGKRRHKGLISQPDRAPDVTTTTKVDPSRIRVKNYGHHMSNVTRDGERDWWFEDQRVVAVFREHHRQEVIR